MIKELFERYSKKWVSLFEDADLRKYLSKGTSGTFLIYLLTMGLTFAVNILLARALGADEFGKYTFVLAWLAVGANAFSLGMDDLALREVPALLSGKQDKKLRLFLAYALRGTFISVLIGLVVGSAIIQLGPWEEIRKLNTYFLPALIALPFSIFILLFQGILRGGQHVLSGQLPEKVIRPAAILLISLLIYFFYSPKEQSAIHYLWGASASIFMACGASFFLFRNKFESPFFASYFRKIGGTDSWNRQLFYFFLLSLLAIINVRIDVLMLGGLGFLDDTGVYNIAAKLVELPMIILLITNTVVAPLYARFQQEGAKEKTQKLFTFITRVVFVLSLPLFGGLILLRHPILSLFGEEFIKGDAVLLILACSQMIGLIMGPAAYALMMLGHGKQVSIALAVVFSLTLILQWIFIPIYGIAGAAVGRGAGIIVGAILYAWLIWRRERVRPGLVFPAKLP
jgi:O-antigen/teichoic acid export membrane protein